MKHNMEKDKITGALYGVAVGDALGAPLEFMFAEQIRKLHGYVTEMLGGGWLGVEPGEVTDDTQMTLAVAEGILTAPEDPVPEVGARFIQWVNSKPKDIGGTCSSAIHMAMDAHRTRPTVQMWMKAAKDTAELNNGRSGGNGALMRTIYPGLYYRALDDAEWWAKTIGCMTHWDDKSVDACILYTRMVHFSVSNGSCSKEALFELLRWSEYENGVVEMRPTGYVVDSFHCALRCFFQSDSFRDAVAMAANLGGDADTIAAITGGLAGAYYGFSAIPQEWVAALDEQVKVRLTGAAAAAQVARADN